MICIASMPASSRLQIQSPWPGPTRPSTSLRQQRRLKTWMPGTSPGKGNFANSGADKHSLPAASFGWHLCGNPEHRAKSGAMSEPIWNKFLTERDKAVFAAGGVGAPAGFRKRPALLVIDVNWAFCGERAEAILESIKRWPTPSGEDARVAPDYIKTLIE